MRAAMYYGNHKLEIEDVPEPTAGDGEVKVRASAATASAAPIYTSTTTGRSSSRPISRIR